MRWGILGTGKIAGAFAQALRHVQGATVQAVASRNADKAQLFARLHEVPLAFGSYEELIAHGEVDIVYIATPHHLHYENTALCLSARKHVLCEKPICMTPQQVEHLAYFAKKNGLFLMEALWSHFMPSYKTVQQWMAGGRIGQVKALDFTFGFRPEYQPESRLFNPALAGGALYDIGIYPIAISMQLVQQRPTHVLATGMLSKEGVDINSSITLRFNDILMNAHVSFEVPLRNEGVIYGTRGHIVLHPRFWETRSVSVYSEEGEEHVRDESEGSGLRHEAGHVQECIQQGLLESPVHPMRNALRVSSVMEEVAKQLKLTYPPEILKLSTIS